MNELNFFPSEAEIKEFQNQLFLNKHIAVILQSDIATPKQERFPVESIFKQRSEKYSASTRVAKVFKTSDNIDIPLKMQIQKACLNNLEFEGYHFQDRGIIIEKENGKAVAIIDGNFDILNLADNKVAVKFGHKWHIIEKTEVGIFQEEIETLMSAKENQTVQDNEICGIHDVKESAYSWRACLLRKFIAKNLEAIKLWKAEAL